MRQPRYRNGFSLTVHDDAVDLPLRWKKPRVVFVNSMSDLFHRDVPTDFIRRCFDVMVAASRHTFQLLTKRPDRAAELARQLRWPENVWMGTSIENASYVDRARILQRIPAQTRFLSIEPLLGPIPRLPLSGIHWVIVGGESGPGARPMLEEWVLQIRDRCIARNVPFFFKQWGGVHKAKSGRVLQGSTWDELPESARGRHGEIARSVA
jgi:protein gp37